MSAMRKLCGSRRPRGRIIRGMLNTEVPYTRTLTLVLPESEWRALRDAEPDAVAWLHSQIRNRLMPGDERRPQSIRSADAAWDEEY